MHSHELSSMLRSIQKWLEVCEANGKPISPQQFYTAAVHSSLLRRIMSGKDPLPHPPPIYFSQPAYELVEQGRGVVNMFLFKSPDGDIRPVVGQSLGWNLDAVNEDGSIVISYPNWGVWDAKLKEKTPYEELWSIVRRATPDDPIS